MFSKTPSSGYKALLGAAFLMATSAVGPGFITQTTVFTTQLQYNFGFVILLSILLDIVVQMNIWRVVAVTGMNAPQLANAAIKGGGTVLTIMVVFGGLVFNIGNIAGCGLALQILFGLNPIYGAAISAVIALIIFSVKEFGPVLDGVTKALGLLMIVIVCIIAAANLPPMGKVLQHSIMPSEFNFLAILTLVGGTVGGYISFAGAHRLLESSGSKRLIIKQVDKSAMTGIVLSGVIRIGLFLALLGVLVTGFVPAADNPTASIFGEALGAWGQQLFGVILWVAAITSVIGASYTSVSFVQHMHSKVFAVRQWLIMSFIIISTVVFAAYGKPVKVLVAAGVINAFVLPFGLAVILIAIKKLGNTYSYKHPAWLNVMGWLVVGLVAYMGLRIVFA